MSLFRSFDIKDSGKREEFQSGMVRDTAEDKIDYTLIADGPMLKRWAIHLTKGAKKYAKRNWMKASGNAELERFRESAFRHFMSWFEGQDDEDHAAAVMFNINGAEYVRNGRSLPEPLQAGSRAPLPLSPSQQDEESRPSFLKPGSPASR